MTPDSPLVAEFDGHAYGKSSYSGAVGNCAYVRRDQESVADSKSRDVLNLRRDAVRALVRYVR